MRHSGALVAFEDGDVPAARPVIAARDAELTYVELVFHRDLIERWIRFGTVADEHRVSLRHRFVGFAPGAVFAFVRWSCNDRGTAVSRVDVLQAVRRSTTCSTIPGVIPGAEILLRLSGWPKVRKVFAAIDAIEALGIDPADVAPDHWRHVGLRVSVGEPARAYTRERHTAWLARREIAL